MTALSEREGGVGVGVWVIGSRGSEMGDGDGEGAKESGAGPSKRSSQTLHSHLPALAFHVESLEEQWGQVCFIGKGTDYG